MTNYRNKQTGGTLLGIILGLIMGLAIALGVAITIKNTPLPFTNKLGKPDKITEPSANQIADPNKPMYGSKDSAKEAAKDFAKKVEEKAAEALPGGINPENKAAPNLQGKAPLVDKSTAEKGADDKFTYFLQAGAFREQADAENTKAKLALMGFSAVITERDSDNGMLYRVRIGPFGQQETMNRMRGKLTDDGVDVAVVRVPK
jgi:cell division protein FtsN